MATKRKRLPRIDVVWRRVERVWVVGAVARPTQWSAVQYAREEAARLGGATVRIHRKDGRIREERTYPRSRDPRRSKG